MKYVIDIDGTICTTTNSEYEKAEPFYDRIKKINDLYDQGHEIVFCTARGMGNSGNNPHLARQQYYIFTAQQLDIWGCKYHHLFLGKPSGDFYIDDKGTNSEDFFTN